MGARTTLEPIVVERDLKARARKVAARRPAVGLAIGVVRGGRLDVFEGHGLADIASKAPVTEDTIFRIASLTKTFTAIAVAQLGEQGLIDLDAPANDYLRAYKLVPAIPGIHSPTVRHLLTHTAGIPEVVRTSDALHPEWGRFESRPATWSVKLGEQLPSLADYYRGRLRVVIEPGTVFAYTNHGFATLTQIIEDVTGMSYERYVRERIFDPLGMRDTDVLRSERIVSRLATGYELTPRGAKAVTDREWIGKGASAIYSSTRDLARYVSALLGGGSNEHGTILEPRTLAMMFEPHFQQDPRLPGIGLAFFRHEISGHRVVGHDGRMPGFHASFLVSPEDGVGVIALTNGSRGAFAWLPIEVESVLRDVLAVPEDAIRDDVAHHPEIWRDLCGLYHASPRIFDRRARMMFGAGAQVFVRGGRLMVRLVVPIPALYRGLPLLPDEADDPYAFRLDLRKFGMPIARVVFGRDGAGVVTALHVDPMFVSLFKRA